MIAGMAIIFCRFENGHQTGLDADAEEVRGYVRGLAAASKACGFRVWVAESMANEAGIDDDTWLSADAWMEREAGV